MKNAKAEVGNDARKLGGLNPVARSQEASNKSEIDAVKRGRGQ